MFRNPRATVPTVSLEGVPLITSFARSSLTGWTVAAGVAESSLVAPLWRNLAITSVMGAILLMVGLAFAVRMATQIARGEMLHNLLIEELNHRVKNTLAVLQSIATQTFRSASRAERGKFEGRLGALAEAHNLLSQEKWQGAELREVIARVLQPYLLHNPERMRMFGPQVPLSPRLAVVLSMIVHEIATTAAAIRCAVERHRHRRGGLGDPRGKRRAQAAAGSGPRPAARPSRRRCSAAQARGGSSAARATSSAAKRPSTSCRAAHPTVSCALDREE